MSDEAFNAFLNTRLAELVGWGFLGFATTAAEPMLRAHLNGRLMLDVEPSRSLDVILEIAAKSALEGRWPLAQERAGLHSLVEYDNGANASVAIVLRRSAGGPVPRIDDGDPLQRLARDAYPALLLRADSHGLSPMPFLGDERYWLSTALRSHPAVDEFLAAVQADADLMTLFANEHESQLSPGFMLNTGTGWGRQLQMLPYDLCVAAHQILRLEDRLDHHAFIASVVDGLDALRRLTRGEPVDVVARLGFAGVDIADGTEFDLPWGRLRPATMGEKEMASYARTGRLKGVVLETRFPLKARIGWPEPGDRLGSGAWSREIAEARAEVEAVVKLTRLALLLGLERVPPVGVVHTWTIIDNPAGQHPLLSWSAREPLVTASAEISLDDHMFLRWGEVINDRYDGSLEVAAGRLLAAVGERDDPADGLIDAAIVLESLFGDRSGELGFRISAACAYLLEPSDPQRRGVVHGTVNRLYGKRSGVVHGSQLDSTQEHRDELVDIALRVVRTLFWTRPELIADPQRARRLILNLE